MTSDGREGNRAYGELTCPQVERGGEIGGIAGIIEAVYREENRSRSRNKGRNRSRSRKCEWEGEGEGQ